MTDDSFPTTDDPEILALLDFSPVERRNKRHDGWSPDHQRGYVIGLALTGNVDRAAHLVDRTQSGAWTVRNSAGADGFGKAWDGAVALYHRRNPRRAPPPPLPKPARRDAAPAEDDDAAQDEDARSDLFTDRILIPYMMKIGQERAARLAGRIVEADFYVRQLTWLEVALDLGGGGPEALKALKRGDHHAGEIAATPMSLLLGEVRRAVWAKMDEPERPPPPALGRHDGEISTGEPMECQYDPERDGDRAGWHQRAQEREAIAAEAQRVWEEKARRDAAEWRARVEGSDDAAEPAAGEPDARP